jgi:hypothetical protein
VRNSDSKSILRSYSRAAGRSEAVDSGWRIFLWWGPLFYAAEKPEKYPQLFNFCTIAEVRQLENI